jgi:bacteriocin-like protein
MTNDIRELNLNELASVSGGTTGFSALITANQAKANDANDNALAGALAGALGGAGAKGPTRRIG